MLLLPFMPDLVLLSRFAPRDSELNDLQNLDQAVLRKIEKKGLNQKVVWGKLRRDHYKNVQPVFISHQCDTSFMRRQCYNESIHLNNQWVLYVIQCLKKYTFNLTFSSSMSGCSVSHTHRNWKAATIMEWRSRDWRGAGRLHWYTMYPHIELTARLRSAESTPTLTWLDQKNTNKCVSATIRQFDIVLLYSEQVLARYEKMLSWKCWEFFQ